MNSFLSSLLARIPIIVPRGPLRGLVWTLYPFTSYWRGIHEPRVISALGRSGIGSGSCIWDVGAHYGYYTLWFARLTGPSGRVFAFEPNPGAYQKLSRHIAANRFTHVTAHPFALARTDGWGEMIDAEHSGTTAHFRYDDEPYPASVLRVALRSIDSLCREGGLPDPAWIKIDAEGYAGEILSGGTGCFHRARPRFLIATHSQPEIDGIRSALEPLGYHALTLEQTPAPWNTLGIGEDYLFLPPAPPPHPIPIGDKGP